MKYTLGKSVQGRDIFGYAIGDPKEENKILIIGCIHGVEPQSKDFCNFFLKEIENLEWNKESFLIVIPCLNPDGLVLKTRQNANGVDLNRNFPSKSWTPIPQASKNKSSNSPYYPGIGPASEPETKAIINLLKKYYFKTVIGIHTNHFIENPNPPMVNYDGKHSLELANKISKVSNLPVHKDVGYPTPGSLGGYIGIDLNKISITIELDDKNDSDTLYKEHGKMFSVI